MGRMEWMGCEETQTTVSCTVTSCVNKTTLKANVGQSYCHVLHGLDAVNDSKSYSHIMSDGTSMNVNDGQSPPEWMGRP